MKQNLLNRLELVLMTHHRMLWMDAESFEKEVNDLYGAYRVGRNNYISYSTKLSEDEKYAIIARERTEPLLHYDKGVVTREENAPTSFFFMHVRKNAEHRVIYTLCSENGLTNETYWERWCSLSDGTILNGEETQRLTTLSDSGEVILKRKIYSADVSVNSCTHKYPPLNAHFQ